MSGALRIKASQELPLISEGYEIASIPFEIDL
jgi:hypothetical protein